VRPRSRGPRKVSRAGQDRARTFDCRGLDERAQSVGRLVLGDARNGDARRESVRVALESLPNRPRAHAVAADAHARQVDQMLVLDAVEQVAELAGMERVVRRPLGFRGVLRRDEEESLGDELG